MASREPNFKREDEDDVDEEVDDLSYKSQKDAIIFAIDVSTSMLERPPPSKSRKADQDSAVSAALRCAYQIMQQRIITQPKDMMGILLFGTEKSKFREAAGDGDGDDDKHIDREDGSKETQGGGLANIRHRGPGYPHCYLFMDLDVPAAEDVKALKELVEEGEDPDEVLTPAPASQRVAMSNVLFCANQVFTTNAANFGSRRLFIITDNDDPHAGDKAARSAAAVRAKDLYDLGVVIELFPISRAGQPAFDLNKFYDDIIYRDAADQDALDGGGHSHDSSSSSNVAKASDRVSTSRSGDGLTLLASLVSNISAKQTPKRSYFSNLTFEVAPGLNISVKGYILLNRQKPARTCYVWLGGEHAQIATGQTTRIDAESARTVEAGETKKAYKFGGEYVYFAPDELKALKEWPFPDGWKGKGLRIIGFKPSVLIPPWASVKRSTFIYPSEEDYVGSTRVFAALWQKLRRSGKVAIAWFVPRVNANPLLVAIMPSGGGSRADGEQGEGESGGNDDNDDNDNSREPANPMQLPAGLWLYPLPFAEDIRRVDDGGPPLPTCDRITDLMKPVIENLFLPKTAYNPAKYPNPSLQWHYKILQTMALEEEVPEHGEDLTLPKYKAIAKRVGGSLAELKGVIDEEARALTSKRAVKRGGDSDDDEGGDAKGKPLAKRPKKAAAAAGASATGGAGKMTAKDLRNAVNNDKLQSMQVAVLKEILAARDQPTSGRKADLIERIEQWVEANL
ncbi:ATP-dependent DNA helicase 2 subunit 1 [Sporothrix schenckii 1099-18]|uniref:ATP-dependent DNA helicase II subunit 1 n=1 Tax=Sporothrix schenckii 1099-18 TaxID=1397361 RepID=A0A0F2MC18_SPOSC|nr:ATP-dependent DNA helicase 2 subunit 1 [Sporothrix schenckii 1099-18]KJR85701.1 ATP-dependent DNA helicase 2 subunit 1 [Sporothrix schenckii 1099-18]